MPLCIPRLRKLLCRLLVACSAFVALLIIGFLIYFPGKQTPIAFTLMTGIGVHDLQSRVDAIEDKAIRGEGMAELDLRFLDDLYRCFAKGARLTYVLRQSADMMDRYLDQSGEDLQTSPRIFLHSQRVQEQMAELVRQARDDYEQTGRMKPRYASPTFYMGDFSFLDSAIGLYYGELGLEPTADSAGQVNFHWRAECPWQWPTYKEIEQKYGTPHAQSFPLPNARSFFFGKDHCLYMDDGLGAHLETIGLAKPFLVYAEWDETLNVE